MAKEPSTRSGTQSGRGSAVAGPAHEDLATDAAAFLARSGHTVESFGGSPEEIDRQAACLVEWAKQRKAFLTDAYTTELKKHTTGVTAEHEVFYRESDDRAVKRTYPGTFGV